VQGDQHYGTQRESRDDQDNEQPPGPFWHALLHVCRVPEVMLSSAFSSINPALAFLAVELHVVDFNDQTLGACA
jgi:hypothetical protein